MRLIRAGDGAAKLEDIAAAVGVSTRRVRDVLEADRRFGINVGIRVGTGTARLPLSEQTVELYEDAGHD